jgi:uncharacterized membrane protein
MTRSNHGPLIAAGILLGAGLGGFADGILLHQILQWHNMLSGVRPPLDLVSMKYNMVWDGIFHAFTWLMTVAGIVRLWQAGKRSDVPWSAPTLAGAFVLGWGLFNAVEGTINHQLLGIHHVHPGAGQLQDVGFIVSGLLMICVGWLAIRSAEKAVDRSRTTGSSGALSARS